MRIVAGLHRGRQLKSPAGQNTRPTSDRVREALFSMLAARLELRGAVVLDLYAGSGALGLEALSRGAARAVFVDHQAASAEVILENARSLDLAAASRVLREDVALALDRLSKGGERFDLVLADPPYADDPKTLLERLDARPVLTGEGLLAIEHSARSDPPEAHGSLSRVVRRRHGDTVLSIYATGVL